MKLLAKSARVDTTYSYDSTPETSDTGDHSSRPRRPLWKVAPSVGPMRTGGSAVMSPLASASSEIRIANPSFDAPPPMLLLDTGSNADAVIGKSFDVVWPLTITVLAETRAICGTAWKLSLTPPLPPKNVW